jgi:photosystem II stability/assembly factor-like uncharacterized protein
VTPARSRPLLYNLSVRSGAITFVLSLLAVLRLSGSAQPTSIPNTGFDSNLRGVSISRARGKLVVWVCGSKGTILRSLDQGKSWTKFEIDGGSDLDFRDIKAFGRNSAYAMSSGDGEKSRIYKTTDGGMSWALQYTDRRPGFFLDSLACDSSTRCLALSDPVAGKFLVLATSDGQHWKEMPGQGMPAALPAEGAFAASGTSLRLCNHDVYFGTGGPAARVFHSANHGDSWTAVETPVAHGGASTGIFSLDCSGGHVVAVGGDYKHPDRAEAVAAYSSDRGKTWHLAEQQPGGYRSAVRLASRTAIAVGSNGEDASFNYGASWKKTGMLDLNAVALTPHGLAWAVGPKGVFEHFQLRDLFHHHHPQEDGIGRP